MRIVRLLDAGVSISEIAAREGLTQRRMRAVVQEILAKRMPRAPAEFLALQVGRLNEALNVSYGAMSGANLGRSTVWSGSCASSTAITVLAGASSGAQNRADLPAPTQAPLAFQAPAVGSAGNAAAND